MLTNFATPNSSTLDIPLILTTWFMDRLIMSGH